MMLTVESDGPGTPIVWLNWKALSVLDFLANAPALLSKRSCFSTWTWPAATICWLAVN
jgi:hypothetical protein